MKVTNCIPMTIGPAAEAQLRSPACWAQLSCSVELTRTDKTKGFMVNPPLLGVLMNELGIGYRALHVGLKPAAVSTDAPGARMLLGELDGLNSYRPPASPRRPRKAISSPLVPVPVPIARTRAGCPRKGAPEPVLGSRAAGMRYAREVLHWNRPDLE